MSEFNNFEIETNNSELEKIEAIAQKRQKFKRKARKKRIYNVILVLLCVVLAVCIFNIGSYFWQDYSNNDFNGDLAGDFIIYGDSSNSQGEEPSDDTSSGSGGGKGGSGSKKEIKVPDAIDMAALKEKYPDSVGWIFSKNGVINYPIVQGKDNSYYLNRMPNGKKNINGSIFMDKSSKSNFSGANTIIYGHSMDNGSMFRTLLNYKKQSYYEKYPEIYIYNNDGKHKMVIFAAYETNSTDLAYNAVISSTSFNKYVAHALKKSKIKTNVEVEVGDRLVTLSTCAYSSKNARFIVVGKLVKDGTEADNTASANTSSGYYGTLWD